MSPEGREVGMWLDKATHDRRTAELALQCNPPIPDVAAFHCQQAVEKLLKAYLVHHGREFEKIHDLRALANLCAEFDPGFIELRELVAPLTTYAVRFRYPSPTEPTVEQVRAAIAVVNEVNAFVLQRVPPDLRP